MRKPVMALLIAMVLCDDCDALEEQNTACNAGLARMRGRYGELTAVDCEAQTADLVWVCGYATYGLCATPSGARTR